MSDLPLCETCGGTGSVHEDVDRVGHMATYPCPAGCVPVKGPNGPTRNRVGKGFATTEMATVHLDPAKVILWCETHGYMVTRYGPDDDDLAKFGPCDIKVRGLGPVYGEPA